MLFLEKGQNSQYTSGLALIEWLRLIIGFYFVAEELKKISFDSGFIDEFINKWIKADKHLFAGHVTPDNRPIQSIATDSIVEIIGFMKEFYVILYLLQ